MSSQAFPQNATAFVCEPSSRLKLTGSSIGPTNTSDFFHSDILLPISLVTSTNTLFRFLLRLVGLPAVTFVSEMLAGIALGPSFLGQNEKFFKKLFTPRTILVLNVFELLGLLYMFFLVSVRMDVSIVRKCGRVAIVIGIGSFVLPLIVTTFMAFLVKKFIQVDDALNKSLLILISLESSISFPVILEVLTDLKLLNSELGRLALSSSLISAAVGWFYLGFLTYLAEMPQHSFKHAPLYTNLSVLGYSVVIFFILRPAMYWIIRQVPEGKPLSREQVFAVNLMVLGCLLFSQFTGILGFWAPMVLGIATPVISPMGSRLVDRIEPFVLTVLFPCFLINAGRGVNLASIKLTNFLIIELLIWTATFSKFFAVLVPSLFYKLPFSDALSLGFLLNCRGIYDVQIFTRAHQRKRLSDGSYSTMVLTAMFKYAVILPLVRAFYNPSRRYKNGHRRRTIQHNQNDPDFRLLACIHEENDVATVIKILGASNPRKGTTTGVYVLNLEEYDGSFLPVVISHQLGKTPSLDQQPLQVDTIFNAFRHFEQQQQQQISSGSLSVQCFTATAPYSSMHEDICSMAFEKCISLIIIPFQKTDSSSIRMVIKNVLKMAPCSVGILVDRRAYIDTRPGVSTRRTTNICVIFIGGSDDREAVAYGGRLAEGGQNVTLTIIRFFAVNHADKDLVEEKCDLNFISGMRMSLSQQKNVNYVQHSVEEGADTFRVMNSNGDDFDLILTGRRHDHRSPALSGLQEWSEIEEFGLIGDMLASSDFKSSASVMVIQQQGFVADELTIDTSKLL